MICNVLLLGLRPLLLAAAGPISAAAPPAAPVPPLPPLNIAPAGITISGISSGADFVVNLHVAHSSVINGVGVFAGQAYHCAVTRFPKDPMMSRTDAHLNLSVPVCDGCPNTSTLDYDHCKNNPEYVDVDLLVAYAQKQSELGAIDNVSNIVDHQLYFYRGTHDTCYKTGSEESTLGFYARLTLDRGTANHVAYEGAVGSNHAQPTLQYGAPCGGHNKTASNLYSYIEDCGYDGAGGVLNHMYGNDLTKPKAMDGTAFDPANLIEFDQSAFWINATHPELKNANLPPDGSGGTSKVAYAYIPKACKKGSAEAAAKGGPCRMHLYHHGCGGPWGSTFYEGISHRAGFNEWAEANDIVIIYPAMTSWGKTGQARAGCWDGYAQTGSDYGLKSGAQISVVRNIITKVAGV